MPFKVPISGLVVADKAGPELLPFSADYFKIIPDLLVRACPTKGLALARYNIPCRSTDDDVSAKRSTPLVFLDEPVGYTRFYNNHISTSPVGPRLFRSPTAST